MASETDVRARLQRAGQGHLLRFWAELGPGPRAALLAELAPLEPDALREHCASAAEACARAPGPTPGLDARLQPLAPERLGSAIRSDAETRRRWEEEGGQLAGGARMSPGRLLAPRGRVAAPRTQASPHTAPLAPRFPPDCPEQGGRAAAGWRAGHSSGGHLP